MDAGEHGGERSDIVSRRLDAEVDGRNIYGDAALNRNNTFRRGVASAPTYRVGEPLLSGRECWPQGSRFALGPAGYELVLFQPQVDAEVVAAVGRGPAEFALVLEPPLILFAYRFGAAGCWGDAPFAWHLQPGNAGRRLPRPAPGDRALLWISLVGSDDGTIHAQRGMTLAPAFTRALHGAIRAQAARPFDAVAHVRAVASAYVGRPDAEARLARCVARAAGNS